MSVGSEGDEDEVVDCKIVVRLPEDRKRRIVEVEEEEKEVEGRGEILIAPLGPRAVCGGFMRRVGSESVFKDADPRLVTGDNPRARATVGISWGTDAWYQSPGVSGGYLPRSKVDYSRRWGYRRRGRGRGV